jgi:NADH-quinone oxidoreductase subunit J
VGVDASDSLVETLRGQRIAALILALGFAGLLIAGIGNALVQVPDQGLAQANSDGNVTGLAHIVFTRYVFAFEVTSALLITAGLGAMVLTHRERLTKRVTQRELMQQRVRAGEQVTPLPSPGVYARHNAVDVPALQPDGTPAAESLPGLVAGPPPPGRRVATPAALTTGEAPDGDVE